MKTDSLEDVFIVVVEKARHRQDRPEE